MAISICPVSWWCHLTSSHIRWFVVLAFHDSTKRLVSGLPASGMLCEAPVRSVKALLTECILAIITKWSAHINPNSRPSREAIKSIFRNARVFLCIYYPLYPSLPAYLVAGCVLISVLSCRIVDRTSSPVWKFIGFGERVFIYFCFCHYSDVSILLKAVTLVTILLNI